MQNHEYDEFINYIDKIITATKTGTIDWVKANPTTYYWTADSPKTAKVIIQRIDKRDIDLDGKGMPRYTVKQTYQFTVMNLASKKEVVSMDGKKSEALNDKLSQLYQTVTIGLTRTGLDFLKEIIPDN